MSKRPYPFEEDKEPQKKKQLTEPNQQNNANNQQIKETADKTLKMLFDGRDRMAESDTSIGSEDQNICSSCKLANVVYVECFYCLRKLCENCVRGCVHCHEPFCSQCSIILYDNENTYMCYTCYR